MATEGDQTRAASKNELSLIDCDIHVVPKSEEEIIKHLPRHYQEKGIILSGLPYSNPTGNVIRSDVKNAEAESTDDSDDETISERHSGKYHVTPDQYRKHLLDEYDIDYGIITGHTNLLGLAGVPDRDYAAELAQAANEWIKEKWLQADDRLVGSITIAPQSPEESAEIIREYASDPRFVQIITSTDTLGLLGKREKWPIYEAAVECGLPIAAHSGASATTLTQAVPGYPSTYFEFHNQMSLKYMAQLNSLICEGVFEKFPDLMYISIEGGVAWLPHLMWRMDKNWKGLRTQAPWLDQPPSEYIYDNVRFTTQPIEEPNDWTHLKQIFEMINAKDILMFSSDFPHWDGDSPEHGFPVLDDELEARIFYENAADIYDLPPKGTQAP